MGNVGLQPFSVSWHSWGLMPAAPGCPVPQCWSKHDPPEAQMFCLPPPWVCPVRCHHPWQRRVSVSLYYSSAKRVGMLGGQAGCPCLGQLSAPCSALQSEQRELRRHICPDFLPPPVSLDPLTRVAGMEGWVGVSVGRTGQTGGPFLSLRILLIRVPLPKRGGDRT